MASNIGCVVHDADMGQCLVGGNSSRCPGLELKTSRVVVKSVEHVSRTLHLGENREERRRREREERARAEEEKSREEESREELVPWS